MSQIEIAKAIATVAHRGQVDKAGNPYIGHPQRVAARLINDSEDVQAAGWLHDVLEDTPLTEDDLRAAGVNNSVIDYVDKLTRRPDERPEDYYDRIKIAWGATKIKRADIADNADPSRLALLDDDATVARLVRKYAKAKLLLGID